MKYTKGKQTYSLEKAPFGKILLTDGIDFTESPWVKVSPKKDHYVLQNDALAFMPFPSWGAIIPSSHFVFLDTLKSQVLELHPDAWDGYLKLKIIDKDGNYIPPKEKKKSS